MTEPRYPGYDVLAKWDSPSWDDTTRRVVADRLDKVPPRRFFTAAEWAVLEAVCARLIPQPDRADPVPIAPWIDDKLQQGRGSGTRYETMPPDGPAMKQGLAALDAESRQRHGRPFAALDPEAADALLAAVQADQVSGDAWHGLPPDRFFAQLLREALEVYYAHPAAWSEIGFGGPASPRGYVRLEADRADPWEARRDG